MTKYSALDEVIAAIAAQSYKLGSYARCTRPSTYKLQSDALTRARKRMA